MNIFETKKKRKFYVPRTSASSIKCVVSKIVLPLLSRCNKSQVNLLPATSIPLVGSSRITIWVIETNKLENYFHDIVKTFDTTNTD